MIDNWKIENGHVTWPLAFHSNYVLSLHRFWDIARYRSKITDFNLPHLYLATPLGRRNFAEIFGVRKTAVPELFCYSCCMAFFAWFYVSLFLTQYRLMTDGQTHDDSMYRASTASCSKKGWTAKLVRVTRMLNA